MRRDKSAAVGLVVCFVAMIAIVGAITFNTYKSKTQDELTKTEEKGQIAKEEKEEEKEEEPSQVTQGEQIQAQLPVQEQVDVPDYTVAETFTFTEKDALIWPVDGNVILNYSMDETVYFSTLDQYKYNPALIISGQVKQEVLAAEDGKVTAIENHAQTGVTVTVSLGDGYEAIYGQLGEICVAQGDSVSQGEIIGYLGEPTKYYSVEGCNLYFQLLKDGEPVNPLEYLDM